MNKRYEARLSDNYSLLKTNVKVLSSGVFLPSQRVSSKSLMEEINSYKNYGIPTSWMDKKVGIHERRYCSSSDSPSSMAIEAAEKAISRCHGLNPDHIDKVIFCGIDKDQAEPATAHVVNYKLGLKASEVYDITDACFGFMRAIQDCIRSIKLGEIRMALVVTGETPSRLAKHLMKKINDGADKAQVKKWIGFLTVGDAGGAILLGGCSPYEHTGFQRFYNRVDSQHMKKCMYKFDYDGNVMAQMMMGTINAYGRKITIEAANHIRNIEGWVKPDHVLTHNTGDGSFAILENMGIGNESNMIRSYSKLGNITSATFPVNYDHLSRKVGVIKGDRIGGLFSGSGFVFGYFDYIV